jgi:hypothetical protein
MRIKLRSSGQQITIPAPPKQLFLNGDPTPVTNRMPFGSPIMGTVQYGPAPTNIGPYIPPPPLPVWTVIPTSIVPTPLTGQQPFKKCRGCK